MTEPKRIGLLGGSFNPAHRGHLLISLTALKRLGLDEVWWLVSPQNPLKPAEGMAGFDERLAAARDYVMDDRITVSDLEARLGTRYTYDTLLALKSKFPDVRFVWLLGADNLIQFHRWRDWREIFRLVPIAIFPRPTYSRRALASRAAKRFHRFRLPERKGLKLADLKAPAWILVRMIPDGISATKIRRQRAHITTD